MSSETISGSRLTAGATPAAASARAACAAPRVSRAPRVPRPRRVRVGVVGAGLVAQIAHLPFLRERDDLFELAGLAEPDAGVRRRVAARYGIERTAPGHRDLLAADLDALLIASPNGAHAEQVLDALDAGVHVLVEKPMCLDPDDAERIVAARDRTGLVVQVGYMKRYDPAVEALASRLGEAEILHVESLTHDPGLRAYFGPAGGDEPAAARDRDEPAPARDRDEPAPLTTRTLAQARAAVGAPDHRRAAWWSDLFLGALVHDVNLVRGLLEAVGTPAVRIADAFAGDDRAGGTLALANGARWTAAWLAMPSVADFAERVTLYTSDGIHRLDFPAPYLHRTPTIYTHARQRDGVHEEHAGRAWRASYELALRHFRACIAGEEDCRTPPEQAADDMALLAALFRAASGGGPATGGDTATGGGATPRNAA